MQHINSPHIHQGVQAGNEPDFIPWNKFLNIFRKAKLVPSMHRAQNFVSNFNNLYRSTFQDRISLDELSSICNDIKEGRISISTCDPVVLATEINQAARSFQIYIPKIVIDNTAKLDVMVIPHEIFAQIVHFYGAMDNEAILTEIAEWITSNRESGQGTRQLEEIKEKLHTVRGVVLGTLNGDHESINEIAHHFNGLFKTFQIAVGSLGAKRAVPFETIKALFLSLSNYNDPVKVLTDLYNSSVAYGATQDSKYDFVTEPDILDKIAGLPFHLDRHSSLEDYIRVLNAILPNLRITMSKEHAVSYLEDMMADLQSHFIELKKEVEHLYSVNTNGLRENKEPDLQRRNPESIHIQEIGKGRQTPVNSSQFKFKPWSNIKKRRYTGSEQPMAHPSQMDVLHGGVIQETYRQGRQVSDFAKISQQWDRMQIKAQMQETLTASRDLSQGLAYAPRVEHPNTSGWYQEIPFDQEFGFGMKIADQSGWKGHSSDATGWIPMRPFDRPLHGTRIEPASFWITRVDFINRINAHICADAARFYGRCDITRVLECVRTELQVLAHNSNLMEVEQQLRQSNLILTNTKPRFFNAAEIVYWFTETYPLVKVID